MERSLLENNVDYNIVLNLPGTMGFLVDICLGLTNPFTPTSSNFKLCRAIKMSPYFLFCSYHNFNLRTDQCHLNLNILHVILILLSGHNYLHNTHDSRFVP